MLRFRFVLPTEHEEGQDELPVLYCTVLYLPTEHEEGEDELPVDRPQHPGGDEARAVQKLDHGIVQIAEVKK